MVLAQLGKSVARFGLRCWSVLKCSHFVVDILMPLSLVPLRSQTVEDDGEQFLFLSGELLVRKAIWHIQRSRFIAEAAAQVNTFSLRDVAVPSTCGTCE
jgi:hypothetical protein